MKLWVWVISTAIITILVITLLSLGCSKTIESTKQPESTRQPDVICDNISDFGKRDTCYLEISRGMNASDLELCGRIRDKSIGEDCYYQLFNNTRLTIDCSLQTGNIRDICNMAVGIGMISSQTCGRIINLDKRDNCYYGVASQKGFPPELQSAFCSYILDEERRNECQQFVDTK
jgi:hypothetical protein